ncbi:MAG: DUF5004 domain-containing protein [Muribaculaceae bacterium]|nr:DUF5004 domain-containing protein [Muribaculaceae bacterium]
MKKTFRLIGMAIMAILFSASLSACSDDNEPDDPDNHDRNLVGTWVTKDSGTNSGVSWTDEISITFNTDGTYSEKAELVFGNESEVWTASGLWSTKDNVLTVTMLESSDPDADALGETESTRYKVDGKKLYLYIEGDDTQVLTKK